MNINLWLSQIIQEYRKNNDDSVLRTNFETASKSDTKLTWEQYLASFALRCSLRENPFLLTTRMSMDLPPETIDALYQCHVDCVADLLQLSEEELAECAQMYNFEAEPVKRYLKKHGHKLRQCSEHTYKIHSLLQLPTLNRKTFKTWSLNPLGAEMEFDLNRPNLNEWWFDKFYSQYEYTEGEEALEKGLRDITPKITGGKLPYDYQEYFEEALKHFWSAYLAVCLEHGLRQMVEEPTLPSTGKDLVHFTNDNLLSYKKDVVRAVVSVLEQKPLFKHKTTADYLAANDEGRLNVAEGVSDDADFQLMLIEMVEVRIDFEAVLSGLKQYWPKYDFPKPKKDVPPNPWLAELITDFRRIHSQEDLRMMYRSRCRKAEPDEIKDWRTFIGTTALAIAANRNGILKMRRKEFSLPQQYQDLFNVNYIYCLADLMQLTREELLDLLEQDGLDIAPIEEMLASHELRLYSYEGYTYKEELESVAKEYKLFSTELESMHLRTKTKFEKGGGPRKERLQEAIDCYEDAERMAESKDCDIRSRRKLLKDYVIMLEDNMDSFPELTKHAPEIAARFRYFTELEYGKKHSNLAGAYRACAAIESHLNHHAEAGLFYENAYEIAGNDINKNYKWAARDANSSGICFSRIPDWKKALIQFRKAEMACEMVEGDKPIDMRDLYYNMAESYRNLGDRENEEKYHKRALAIGVTN